MRGAHVVDRPAGRGTLAHPGDRHRHPGCLVVQVEPLLVQSAVGAEQIAVIGGAHQHRLPRDRASHPVDRIIHLGVQAVVQVAVLLGVGAVGALDDRRRAVAGRIGGPVGDLGGRLRRQVLIRSGRRRHRRRVERRRLDRVAPQPRRKQHDVVRVDEAGHQQKRAQGVRIAGGPPGVAVLEPGDHPGGDQRVAPDAGVGQRRAVGLGPHPAGEPERVEQVGVQVGLHRCGVDVAIVIVGGQRFASLRVDQVGVADVPLAVVMGVVTGGPKPVTQRGHLAFSQPTQAGVVGRLAQPVGLGHPVHVGVLPGEQCRTAGHASERTGVVPGEGNGVVIEPTSPGERVAPPGEQLVALVRRNGPLLVGHDHDHVRAGRRCGLRHGTAPSSQRPGRPASSRNRLPGGDQAAWRPAVGAGVTRSRPWSSR